MDAQPVDPFSQLQVGASALHEFYRSLCDAGFSRGEALTLLAKVIAEQAPQV